MQFNPETIVAEVLGQRAQKGFDPSSMDYICPFLESRCVKRSKSLGDEPYPVCSIYRNIKDTGISQVCVCPKRFYEIDLINDVVNNCWPGEKPLNPRIAREVRMEGFGNVDFVIADVDASSNIGQFLSVEVQAIDITGSVMTAYQALRKGEKMPKRPTYGLNWDNVYKRYVTQLIRKGYFHHHWGTKIVAVMQDVVYSYMCRRAEFMRSTDIQSNSVNIIFMPYKYTTGDEMTAGNNLIIQRIEGTSHANLQQAFMYKETPSRDAFCNQIKRSLDRS